MIYTGYYAKIKEYEQNGLVVVGVSGKIPDGFNGKRYQKLAPKYDWWHEWHDKKLSNEWFKQKYYETVLNQLDAVSVVKELQDFGENIVLLCYETPEKFCHRHLAAEWLKEKAQLNVVEFELQNTQISFSF